MAGGGQERELRSGTHDVAGIVGFAAALRAVAADPRGDGGRHAARRDRLADGLLAAVPGLVETAPPRSHRLPGTLHVCLPGVESEAVLFLLDEAGVCASAASACASGAQQASHVLAAMGVSPERARGRAAAQPRLDDDRRRRRSGARGRRRAAVAHLRGVAA